MWGSSDHSRAGSTMLSITSKKGRIMNPLSLVPICDVSLPIVVGKKKGKCKGTMEQTNTENT